MKKDWFHILQHLIIGTTGILMFATYILTLLMGRAKWYEPSHFFLTLLICIICNLFIPHILLLITAVKAYKGKWGTAKILMIFALAASVAMLPVSYAICVVVQIESPVMPKFWMVYVPLIILSAGEIIIDLIYFKRKN